MITLFVVSVGGGFHAIMTFTGGLCSLFLSPLSLFILEKQAASDLRLHPDVNKTCSFQEIMTIQDECGAARDAG